MAALRCRRYMRFPFTCLSIALKAQRRTLLSTARLKALEAGLVFLLFNTAKASRAAHHVCCQLQARSLCKVTAPDPDSESFCDEIIVVVVVAAAAAAGGGGVVVVVRRGPASFPRRENTPHSEIQGVAGPRHLPPSPELCAKRIGSRRRPRLAGCGQAAPRSRQAKEGRRRIKNRDHVVIRCLSTSVPSGEKLVPEMQANLLETGSPRDAFIHDSKSCK